MHRRFGLVAITIALAACSSDDAATGSDSSSDDGAAESSSASASMTDATNVCGYCEMDVTSCEANGMAIFDGAGDCGIDDLGQIVCGAVHWTCI